MADDEEYEIMPHKTINKIKKEIDNLKEKAKSSQEIASPGFKSSIDNLNKSINSLMGIFKEASEEMKIEDKSDEEVHEKLGPLVQKVSQIEEENKRIAEGIVVVADMVKELKSKIEKPRPIPRPVIRFPEQRRVKLPDFGKPKTSHLTGRPIPTQRNQQVMQEPSFMSGAPRGQLQRKVQQKPLPQQRPFPPDHFQQPKRFPPMSMSQRPEPVQFPGNLPEPKPFPALDKGLMGEMPLPPEPPKKKGFFSRLFKK